MGIDKSNVRFVVHYDLPKNIESYYQETGRAGRDGLPAEALLLFGHGDIAISRGLIEKGGNPEQKRIELHKLQAMVAFAEAQSCRRRVLLGDFGERLGEDCGNCDVCLNPPERYDATVDAQKALSCVFRVGQRFGIGHVVDVLRGARSERIRELGHDRLSTYGPGAEQSAQAWTGLIRQLIPTKVSTEASVKILALDEVYANMARTTEPPETASKATREPARTLTPEDPLAQLLYDPLFSLLYDRFSNG